MDLPSITIEPEQKHNNQVSRTVSSSPDPHQWRRYSQDSTPSPNHLYATYRNSLTNLKSTDTFRPDLNFEVERRQLHFHSPPSTDRQKQKATKKAISTVLGLCYVIFLVIFALIVFVGKAFIDLYPLPQIFFIACIVVGFMYLIFLYIRVRQSISVGVTDEDSSTSSDICHRYCFINGRHGQLYYLKLGATVFCLGSVIHSGLLLSYQVVFLTSENPEFIQCASRYTLVLEMLFPLYSLFVLFFLFKYANIIINEYRELARIGLMHNIGTVLAMWIYTIVRETKDAIFIHHSVENSEEFDEEDLAGQTACPGADALNEVFKDFSPYLYPFTIEFCIVTAGIFYMMWANVSKCQRTSKLCNGNHIERKDESGDDNLQCFDAAHDPISVQRAGSSGFISRSGSVKSLAHPQQQPQQQQHESNNRHNNIIYVDCHAANRGIFAAMILLMATIVVIILLFIVCGDDTKKFDVVSFMMHAVYDITVVVVMLVATIAAYYKTSKLDITPNHVSQLDDVLLFLAIPAFFANVMFTAVPAFAYGKFLGLIECFLNLLQVLVQTPWIIDGLRRCSNSYTNIKVKPGRGLVTFLTGANVTLWIYYTFAAKESAKADVRYEFYGDMAWTILNHLTTPLIMFYRFHASVCLVDIWKHAYEPSTSH